MLSGPRGRSAGFVFFVVAWLLPGLLGRDPWKPDEAYTVGLVHSMLRTGDWVVPMLAGEPFMEKPPLVYVSAALSASLFGGFMAQHDAARLAAAFYVGLTLVFVRLTAGRLFGREAGVAAVLALLGCVGYFHSAHLLVVDNGLVAGVAVGLYGLASARERPRAGGLLLGTGAGIAFLSKGLIGPGVLGIAALALSAFSPWRSGAYARSLAWATAAFAPWALVWPLLLYERSPVLFHEWLVINNFGRFTGNVDLGPEHDHWMYVKILPWFALPALPLAAWAVWRAWRERTPAIAVPVVALLVLFAVLSAACSARSVYALPMLVPLSILAGAGCRDAPPWLARGLFWLAAAGAAIALLALWLGWAALVLNWPAGLAASLVAFRPGFAASLQPLPLVFAAATTVGAVAGLHFLGRSRIAAVGAWALAAAAVWAVFFTIWLPYQEYGNSYRGVVAQLKAHLPGQAACIAYRDVGEPQRAMLDYFGGIVMRPQTSPGARDCPLLLVQQQRSDRPPEAAGWIPLWSGSRPGDAGERFWLLASEQPEADMAADTPVSGSATERSR